MILSVDREDGTLKIEFEKDDLDLQKVIGDNIAEFEDTILSKYEKVQIGKGEYETVYLDKVRKDILDFVERKKGKT